MMEYPAVLARDMNAPQPTLAECLAGEFGCYACHWRGESHE